MPTYDYKCGACGHAFEHFQSMTADPIRKCPACRKLKVKRLIGTGAGLIFKGSGFYITDYRDQSYKDKAKAESGTGGGSDKGGSNGEAKTDTAGAGGAAATPAATESKPTAPAAAPAAETAPKTASKSAAKQSSPKKRK